MSVYAFGGIGLVVIPMNGDGFKKPTRDDKA